MEVVSPPSGPIFSSLDIAFELNSTRTRLASLRVQGTPPESGPHHCKEPPSEQEHKPRWQGVHAGPRMTLDQGCPVSGERDVSQTV